MEGVVQGASLGAAFEVLFTSVGEATQRVATFNSDLNRLNSTLRSIKSVIHDIDRCNKVLDRPHQKETRAFVVRLMKGEKLVKRCSKVRRWNVLKRVYYSMKLSRLEASLVKFFQVDVAALHFLESKRISVALRSLEDKINMLLAECDRSEGEINDLKNEIYNQGKC